MNLNITPGEPQGSAMNPVLDEISRGELGKGQDRKGLYRSLFHNAISDALPPLFHSPPNELGGENKGLNQGPRKNSPETLVANIFDPQVGL